MATIVVYTDRTSPENGYPHRIVSPLRSSPCCFSDMAEVGAAQREGRWLFQYRRCRQCGFTVRVITREFLDEGLAAELRGILKNAFVRNVPGL